MCLVAASIQHCWQIHIEVHPCAGVSQLFIVYIRPCVTYFCVQRALNSKFPVTPSKHFYCSGIRTLFRRQICRFLWNSKYMLLLYSHAQFCLVCYFCIIFIDALMGGRHPCTPNKWATFGADSPNFQSGSTH